MRLEHWLEELNTLPAEAPEWDNVHEFLERLTGVATNKHEERRLGRERLRTAINGLLSDLGGELAYFGLPDCSRWEADACPVPMVPPLAEQVEQFGGTLRLHARVRQQVASTLAEDQERLRTLNQLQEDVQRRYVLINQVLVSSAPTSPGGAPRDRPTPEFRPGRSATSSGGAETSVNDAAGSSDPAASFAGDLVLSERAADATVPERSEAPALAVATAGLPPTSLAAPVRPTAAPDTGPEQLSRSLFEPETVGAAFAALGIASAASTDFAVGTRPIVPEPAPDANTLADSVAEPEPPAPRADVDDPSLSPAPPRTAGDVEAPPAPNAVRPLARERRAAKSRPEAVRGGRERRKLSQRSRTLDANEAPRAVSPAVPTITDDATAPAPQQTQPPPSSEASPAPDEAQQALGAEAIRPWSDGSTEEVTPTPEFPAAGEAASDSAPPVPTSAGADRAGADPDPGEAVRAVAPESPAPAPGVATAEVGGMDHAPMADGTPAPPSAVVAPVLALESAKAADLDEWASPASVVTTELGVLIPGGTSAPVPATWEEPSAGYVRAGEPGRSPVGAESAAAGSDGASDSPVLPVGADVDPGETPAAADRVAELAVLPVAATDVAPLMAGATAVDVVPAAGAGGREAPAPSASDLGGFTPTRPLTATASWQPPGAAEPSELSASQADPIAQAPVTPPEPWQPSAGVRTPPPSAWTPPQARPVPDSVSVRLPAPGVPVRFAPPALSVPDAAPASEFELPATENPDAAPGIAPVLPGASSPDAIEVQSKPASAPFGLALSGLGEQHEPPTEEVGLPLLGLVEDTAAAASVDELPIESRDAADTGVTQGDQTILEPPIASADAGTHVDTGAPPPKAAPARAAINAGLPPALMAALAEAKALGSAGDTPVDAPRSDNAPRVTSADAEGEARVFEPTVAVAPSPEVEIEARPEESPEPVADLQDIPEPLTAEEIGDRDQPLLVPETEPAPEPVLEEQRGSDEFEASAAPEAEPPRPAAGERTPTADPLVDGTAVEPISAAPGWALASAPASPASANPTAQVVEPTPLSTTEVDARRFTPETAEEQQSPGVVPPAVDLRPDATPEAAGSGRIPRTREQVRVRILDPIELAGRHVVAQYERRRAEAPHFGGPQSSGPLRAGYASIEPGATIAVSENGGTARDGFQARSFTDDVDPFGKEGVAPTGVADAGWAEQEDERWLDAGRTEVSEGAQPDPPLPRLLPRSITPPTAAKGMLASVGQRGAARIAAIATAGLALIGLPLVAWNVPGRDTPKVSLQDGSRLTLDYVSYGREHRYQPRNAVQSAVAARFPQAIGEVDNPVTTEYDSLVFWVNWANRPGLSGAVRLPDHLVWPGRVVAVDQDGCRYDNLAYRNRGVFPGVLPAFPRRQKEFQAELWAESGMVARFNVSPQQVPPTNQKWTAQPYPIEGKLDRLDVSLISVKTGLPWTAIDRDPIPAFLESRQKLETQELAREEREWVPPYTSREWTQLRFRVNGSPNELQQWRLAGLTIADATGNSLAFRMGFEALHSVLANNGQMWAAFPGGLCPKESPWRVRMQFQSLGKPDVVLAGSNVQLPRDAAPVRLSQINSGSLLHLKAVDLGAGSGDQPGLTSNPEDRVLRVRATVTPGEVVLPDAMKFEVTDSRGIRIPGRTFRLGGTPASPVFAFVMRPPSGVTSVNFKCMAWRTRSVQFDAQPTELPANAAPQQ